ncbi:hypothetical protein AB5N19_05197 [Seiridium cardinale]
MPRQSPRKRSTVVTKTEIKTESPASSKGVTAPAKATKKTTSKRKIEAAVDDDGELDVKAEQEIKTEITETKPAKKRRTAKQKPEDMPPLAQRSAVASLKKAMFIGAHVSAAGGVQNSLHNAVHIGANAFALFLKSQRKWENPPLAADAIASFHACSKQHSWDVNKHCVPHGSYLVNLAAAEKAKADQAYNAFLDDLKRCEQLGIRLYNFHPGNTNGEPREEAVARIAGQLNKAHKATKGVVTLLENMAGQGNVVGTTFEDLRDIIALVEDKSRVGVCIDTCHAFAAGYDIRTADAFTETIGKFNEIVGKEYLKAFHLNDSKAPFNSHRDLHANIGTGFLGLRAFHNFMNHDDFAGLPMVLETPIDKKGPDGKTIEDKQVWADEIKLLESLIGMDPETEDFQALDKKLQKQGEGERNKIQDQVDRKTEKDAKKGTKGKRGKKKKAAESDEESESD